MEENTLYDRIGEADLNPTYKDGQTFQHTDVNNMLSILKSAVNENYHDIQKIENGEKEAGDSIKLNGATLSKYIDEELQPDDNKVPSSQQVKAYMDALLSEYSAPVRGVDYWNNEDKEFVVDEAANAVIGVVSPEITEAIEEMKESAFTTFSVIDGKLIAGYSRRDEDYYFQLNGNKLEVVLSDE